MAVLPGSRIRSNGVYGTITDNPLTVGATSFNSAKLVDLPVVSSNHAIITLDPLKQSGDPEIVMVTAHTASATVATIQRGMYGTTARSHSQGTAWVHAPARDDYPLIVTSSTRPSDQYEGQLVYETDTDRFMLHTGSEWRQPHNPPACRVYNTASISIPHNTLTAPTFDSERYDTDTMHSTSSNTGRITFTTAGVYVVSFSGEMAAGTYTRVRPHIRLNGTTHIAVADFFENTASSIEMTITTMYKFAANDYVEVLIGQVNGASAARNLLNGGNYSPEFSATWVGVG